MTVREWTKQILEDGASTNESRKSIKEIFKGISGKSYFVILAFCLGRDVCIPMYFSHNYFDNFL